MGLPGLAIRRKVSTDLGWHPDWPDEGDNYLIALTVVSCADGVASPLEGDVRSSRSERVGAAVRAIRHQFGQPIPEIANQSPEQRARDEIGGRLRRAGWCVQSRNEFDTNAACDATVPRTVVCPFFLSLFPLIPLFPYSPYSGPLFRPLFPHHAARGPRWPTHGKCRRSGNAGQLAFSMDFVGVSWSSARRCWTRRRTGFQSPMVKFADVC